jgi:hypothetical protein
MAEALHVVWMLGHPFERAELGAIRFLKGGVGTGGQVLVLSFLEEPRDGLIDQSEAVKPRISSASCPKKPPVDCRFTHR